MVEDCVFCEISNWKIHSKIIYSNDNFLSIPDANPIVDGHSLVISKRHFDNILDTPSSLGLELLDCIKKTSLILIEKKKAEGINVVNNNFKVAGQLVNHVHFHIIPRKKGDGIRFLVRE